MNEQKRGMKAKTILSILRQCPAEVDRTYLFEAINRVFDGEISINE